jgi:hypothetical protein
MAILEHTPTKLIIQFRPWYVWAISPILAILLIPQAIFLAPSLQNISLNCQRVRKNDGICQIITSDFITSQPQTISLADIKGAKVNVKEDGEKKPLNVVLITKNSEIPILYAPISSGKYEDQELYYVATNINQFIKNPEEKTLTWGKSRPSFLIWVFIFAMGCNFIWLGFYSEVTTCDFDKTRGTIIKKRQWFWIITKTVEFPLHEIIDIKIEEKWFRSVKGNRITLMLASGKDLPLSSYHANFLKKRKTLEVRVDAISEFLNRSKLYS